MSRHWGSIAALTMVSVAWLALFGLCEQLLGAQELTNQAGSNPVSVSVAATEAYLWNPITGSPLSQPAIGINAGELAPLSVCCGSNNLCSSTPASATLDGGPPAGLVCSAGLSFDSGQWDTASCANFQQGGPNPYSSSTNVGFWTKGGRDVAASVYCGTRQVITAFIHFDVSGTDASDIQFSPGTAVFIPRPGGQSPNSPARFGYANPATSPSYTLTAINRCATHFPTL